MLKPAKGRPLSLWESCWSAIQSLRPAFSRQVSFMWFATVVAGLMVRPELRGVTSIIRALNLRPKLYDPLRKHFHSSAIKLDQLAALWTQAVLRLFLSPVRVNGRLVVVGDGIKVPKRGKKMPAVKLLHQQSNCSTKPEYIMGHSLQAVALLVNAASSVFAIPLAVRIHEGLVWSNRDQRTLLDKMLGLIHTLTITEPFYFVADAFYAAGKIVNGLLKQGNHLVSRVRSNAVAYLPAQPPKARRKRGRPKRSRPGKQRIWPASGPSIGAGTSPRPSDDRPSANVSGTVVSNREIPSWSCTKFKVSHWNAAFVALDVGTIRIVDIYCIAKPD